MFAYIKGVLVEASPAGVVLDHVGIGYRVFIPLNTYNQLPQIGEQLLLHLSFVVRELSQTLYGFLSVQERDFFEVLMGVTGVGPKLALAIIGHMPFDALQEAIVHENTASLCRIPGIGKKSAERLIIELRDKVNLAAPPSPAKHFLHSTQDPKSRRVNDAMSALISLGYKQSTAQKAIKRSLEDLPEEFELSSLIAIALKHV